MRNSSVLASAGVIVCIILCVATAGRAHAQQRGDAVGVVTVTVGAVSVESNGLVERVVPGSAVYVGDVFRTGEDSALNIMLDDDTLLTLGADAELEITRFIYNPAAERNSTFRVLKGILKAVVERFAAGPSEVRFVTPRGVAGIKGTVLYVDADRGVFYVLEGTVHVRGTAPQAAEVVLTSGTYTVIPEGGSPSSPAAADDELREGFEKATHVEPTPGAQDPSREEDYPGSEAGDDYSKTFEGGSAGWLASNLPLRPPVDLLPSVDVHNRALVEVVIPTPPGP